MCQSVQDGSESMKWPGIDICHHYPWDTVTPAGLKNDVNSTDSVERNKIKRKLFPSITMCK